MWPLFAWPEVAILSGVHCTAGYKSQRLLWPLKIDPEVATISELLVIRYNEVTVYRKIGYNGHLDQGQMNPIRPSVSVAAAISGVRFITVTPLIVATLSGHNNRCLFYPTVLL